MSSVLLGSAERTLWYEGVYLGALPPFIPLTNYNIHLAFYILTRNLHLAPCNLSFISAKIVPKNKSLPTSDTQKPPTENLPDSSTID